MSLLFGKARSNSSQSSSPNFDNHVVYERVIDNPQFNSFDDNHRQVILTKAKGDPVTPLSKSSGPIGFSTPPSSGRPSGKDGKIEVLAKSNHDNQKKVIDILKKLGY